MEEEEARVENEKLNRIAVSHFNGVLEALRLQSLNRTPDSSAKKPTWEDVIRLGERVSENATILGMRFTEKEDAETLEEMMEVYFRALHRLLLFAHRCTVGARPTLSFNIHASIKQVVYCSFNLWVGFLSSYGTRNKEQKYNIPELVAAVGNACSVLLKTPTTNTTTNIMAIERAMTGVYNFIEDALIAMRELDLEPKPEPKPKRIRLSDTKHDLFDFGELSPGQKAIARFAIRTVSKALAVIKEVTRSFTGLIKKGKFSEENGVESLETLLKLCHVFGIQVDDLASCVFPPQKSSSEIAEGCTVISDLTHQLHKACDSLNFSTEAFSQGCQTLRSHLDMLKHLRSDFVPQT